VFTRCTQIRDAAARLVISRKPPRLSPSPSLPAAVARRT